MRNRFYQKMFLSSRYFTVSLRKRDRYSIIDNTKFVADYTFPATVSKWSADPILVDYCGKTYLFYESYIDNHGRIEVVEVNSNCTVSSPKIVLDGDCHYSYPFVFNYNDIWYMIPETSDSNQIRLYESVSFPDKWKVNKVLLNQKSVDTTVFNYNDKIVLLTFNLTESEKVVPYAYLVNIQNDDIELLPLEWQNYDGLKVRGAGGVFCVDKKYYRPVQISRENVYGDAVAFYEILLHDNIYEERECSRLTFDNIKIEKRVWFDGLHTYSLSNNFEAIDIRCRDFDIFKLLH